MPIGQFVKHKVMSVLLNSVTSLCTRLSTRQRCSQQETWGDVVCPNISKKKIALPFADLTIKITVGDKTWRYQMRFFPERKNFLKYVCGRGCMRPGPRCGS